MERKIYNPIQKDQVIFLKTADDTNGNDLLPLSKLMNDLGYETAYAEMKERFKNIRHHPDYKTYVAFVGEEMVGMAGAIQNYFYE